jgi:DNA-binding LacI/PurR family transcriptional regulator
METIRKPQNYSVPRPRDLHRQISDQILADIQAGRLALGDKLPSQTELQQKYQVSVGTIRQSLATLERRGIIRKINGLGSFISLQANTTRKVQKLRSVGLIFERTGRSEDIAAEDQILLAFSDVCREKGMRLISAETDFDSHLGGHKLIQTFQDTSMDGICVFLHEPADAWERISVLKKEFTASVFFVPGLVLTQMPIDVVEVDLRTGMEQLMDYLLALGHRRIGYVGSHIQRCLAGDEKVTGLRWQTYRDCLAKSGVPLNLNYVVDFPYDQDPTQNIVDAVVNLIKQPEPVTAIFAANDWIARNVQNWLWKAEIYVPRDVSLAGADDISFAKALVPSLTTVAFPFAQAASMAVSMMEARLLDNNRPIQKMTIPNKLIIRESVTAPAS